MTTQEILDLAAEFDLITFGPQDLEFFARELEKRTIERCAKVCADLWCKEPEPGDARDCYDAIRALGDNDE